MINSFFFFAYNFLGDVMHLYKTIKNFLYDQESFVSFFDKYIHVYGFSDIETLLENKIILHFSSHKLLFTGNDFRVLKLTKNEILVQGTLIEMKVLK